MAGWGVPQNCGQRVINYHGEKYVQRLINNTHEYNIVVGILLQLHDQVCQTSKDVKCEGISMSVKRGAQQYDMTLKIVVLDGAQQQQRIDQDYRKVLIYFA